MGIVDQRLDFLLEFEHLVLEVALHGEGHAEREPVAQPLVHPLDGRHAVDRHEVKEHQHDGDHHGQRDQHGRHGAVGVFLHLLGARNQRTLRRGHITLDGGRKTAVKGLVLFAVPPAAQRIGPQGRRRVGTGGAPEGEVVVRHEAQLGRGEGQRVEERLLKRLALGHEQRVFEPLHALAAKAVARPVAENRKADQRDVLLVRSIEHLLGQLDIPFVGLENLARIPAQVAQFEKRDHTRKKQQADDAQKTDRHPFAQTRHSVLNFHSCKYSD